ncbi:MAG: undecaprenyl-diphosphate phosphatase, partial [Candidatus Thorarchaeota archaeon]
MIIPLLVLALMQGVLEFLPVSSEGQLLLIAVNVYGIDAATALSIIFWLHLGTAIAVIAFYYRDIFNPVLIRMHTKQRAHEGKPAEKSNLFGPLFVFVLAGSTGTALIALPLYFLLRSYVTHLMGETISALVGVLLIITGVVLFFQQGRKGDLGLEDISVREAFVLGLIQGFAVLP